MTQHPPAHVALPCHSPTRSSLTLPAGRYSTCQDRRLPRHSTSTVRARNNYLPTHFHPEC